MFNKVVRTVLISFAVFVTTSANAGFVTGYVMGSSGNNKAPIGPAQLFASDQHDTIICQSRADRPNICENVTANNRYGDMTPAEFAGAAGYTKLHKKGIVMYDRTVYIIMEVSK